MHFLVVKGVTTVGKWAYFGCSSLSSVTISDSVASIGDRAFVGCDNLARFDLRSSGCKLGKKLFGNTIPKGLCACVENLSPDLQTEIFMTLRGKSLISAYEKCVTDPDAMGKNILSRISQKPTVKECNSAATFLTIFSQKASVDTLQQIYDALKPLKNATRALKTIESDATLQMKLNR